MERKIGEIFECNGEWYQAINNADGIMCSGCAFVNENNECEANKKVVDSCGCKNDNKLIFKKLEPIGDPFPFYDHIVQRYEGMKFPVILPEGLYAHCNTFAVDIEVKQDKPNIEDMETKEKTMLVPDGWEFDRIDESGNIVLKEKKEELPNTWNGCIKALDGVEYIADDAEVYQYNNEKININTDKNLLPRGLGKPMLALCQLLVCRNAWWKQLEWKPDWQEASEKFVIGYKGKHVVVSTTNRCSMVLAFPTSEVRDQFAETFRDLIDEAKELL